MIIGSSIWGFTLDQDREFVAIAQHDGTAFAEVVGENGWNWLTKKKAGTLDYIGRLPGHSEPSMWREIRDYHGRWAVIASEAPGHGVQIFDMRKARRPIQRPLRDRLTGILSSAPRGATVVAPPFHGNQGVRQRQGLSSSRYLTGWTSAQRRGGSPGHELCDGHRDDSQDQTHCGRSSGVPWGPLLHRHD